MAPGAGSLPQMCPLLSLSFYMQIKRLIIREDVPFEWRDMTPFAAKHLPQNIILVITYHQISDPLPPSLWRHFWTALNWWGNANYEVQVKVSLL